jgi:hypothetical protein
MSYPVWTDPGPWDETKHAAFKQQITDGCVGQTPEVQAAWGEMADHMIAIADLFATTIGDGIVQVLMQANNEADENEENLHFRVIQRVY